MRVRHPYALDDDKPDPDGAVHWGGRREISDVDDDGTFHVPDDRAAQFVDSWPEADGYTLADLRADENGSVDRTESENVQDEADFDIEDGVCPWCDDYEGDHVGQHASSAHPDAWANYKGD